MWWVVHGAVVLASNRSNNGSNTRSSNNISNNTRSNNTRSITRSSNTRSNNTRSNNLGPTVEGTHTTDLAGGAVCGSV